MSFFASDDDWAGEFPLTPGLAYLNHAAVSPWPARTRDAISAFAAENARTGARDYGQWVAMENRLRRQILQLINGRCCSEVAFQKNTSEGLSTIARGLTWFPGDEVVIPDSEFPSNRIVWESLASKGVRLVRVSLADEPPEQALIKACSDRTRLLSVSSVQYGNGLRLNLDVLGRHCRSAGILFCIDAIQSLGVLPFDVQSHLADFVVADGHKWLLSPEGLAILYVRQECIPLLEVQEYGWHMVKHAGDYTREDWEIAPGARRFECGSPNMLAASGMTASLGLLLEVGIESIQQRVEQRINNLLEALQAMPDIEILTPHEPCRRAGILTFRSRRVDTARLFEAFAKAQVICAQRGGGIRWSPHFYTPSTSLQQAIETLHSLHA